MVEKMKFKKMVHPGDQLFITVTVVSQHEESALFETKIEVEGKIVTSGNIIVGIMSANNPKFSKMSQSLEEHFRLIFPDPLNETDAFSKMIFSSEMMEPEDVRSISDRGPST